MAIDPALAKVAMKSILDGSREYFWRDRDSVYLLLNITTVITNT